LNLGNGIRLLFVNNKPDIKTFDFVEATFDFVEKIVRLVAFDNVDSTLLLVWTGLNVFG